ncbi:alpha/beta fold hydrolase [Geodermatophilaceae bacterium NBWT11]|nr:alpha/beta fold hydrolase [Geodermatophilaceae bacterium NBWT11]
MPRGHAVPARDPPGPPADRRGLRPPGPGTDAVRPPLHRPRHRRVGLDHRGRRGPRAGVPRPHRRRPRGAEHGRKRCDNRDHCLLLRRHRHGVGHRRGRHHPGAARPGGPHHVRGGPRPREPYAGTPGRCCHHRPHRRRALHRWTGIVTGVVAAAASYRAGAGEPLVLIHGAETSWQVWRPVLDLLTPHHDVLAPTLPGHRGGPPLAGPAGVDLFVDSVERYLDEAGLDTAHIAGNSLGGIIALELVRRGRARSAVNFCGPAGGTRASFTAFHERTMAAARLGRIPGLSPALIALGARSPWLRGKMLSGGVVHGDRMTRTEFETLMADGAFADVGRHLVPWLLDGHELQRFDVGSVPTVIAWGDQDGAVPLEEFGRPTHELARGSQLVVLPGTAHMPVFDDPEAVVRTILATTASTSSD